MTIDNFLELEKKYNANNLNYKGFSYWTYHRSNIYETCCSNQKQVIDNQSGKRATDRWKQLYTRLQSIYRIRKNNMKLRKSDVVILNCPRKINVNGLYECIYTSELAKTLNNYIILEYPYEEKHFWPTVDENVAYMDKLILKSILYYKVSSFSPEYRSYKKKVIEDINELINELSQSCHTINIDSVATLITNDYFRYKYEKHTLMSTINIVSPKVILEIDSGSWQSMILNEIAKEKGIVTIELQHGTMGKGHLSYDYPPNVSILQFPDYIFTFFNPRLNSARFPIPYNHLIETGYPFFERAIKKYPMKKQKNGVIRILFISQFSIGPQLSSLAINLSHMINHDQYEIVYALHPKEYSIWRERYDSMENNGIEVVGDSNKSIYEYLSQADIAVGVCSTALIEGLVYEIKTFLYNIEGVEGLQNFVEEGFMTLFDDERELLNAIQNAQCSLIQQANFWKRNSLQNMHDEIEKILR